MAIAAANAQMITIIALKLNANGTFQKGRSHKRIPRPRLKFMIWICLSGSRQKKGVRPSCLGDERQNRLAAIGENLGATYATRNAYTVLGLNPWSTSMATQIVMDQTGDTRHYFNADDTEAFSQAEKRFKLLTNVGFTAAVRDAAGEATVIRSFDPTAEETLFFPRLVGG